MVCGRSKSGYRRYAVLKPDAESIALTCIYIQIIASSKYLGVLPSTLGSMDRVDWIPVDILADIIVEMAGAAEFPSIDGVNNTHVNGIHKTDPTIPIYHAVNPKVTEWAKLIPTIRKHIGQSVKVVTWGEWVDVLRNSSHDGTAANVENNPALKLLDFFQSVARAAKLGENTPVLETTESVKKSSTLASLKPVSEEWMESWLKQWKF